MKKFIFLFPLLTTNLVEGKSNNHLITGFVLDSITKKGVYNAHIINWSSFKGTTTDSTGFFQILLNTNDSILVQSIEYKRKKICISSNAKDTLIILLSQLRYNIEEVTVGILGNYEQFKQMVLNYNPDEHKIKIPGLKEPKQKLVPILEDKEYWNDIKRIKNPVSFFYYNFSKHAKSMFKFHEMKKQEQEQHRADQKFNRELVKSLTGLKDENQIDNFILFCNFSHEYIMKTDEYEICRQILIKYEIFKKEN